MIAVQQVQEESVENIEIVETKSNYYLLLLDIAGALIPLSWTSFGGPAAHIAMYHDVFVTGGKWLTDRAFTELFAISQSLPGPASTQLVYSICLLHAGLPGGILGFLLWSFPGLLIMIGFSYGVNQLDGKLPIWLQYTANGLTSAALGLVALAAFKLSTKLLVRPLTVMIGVLAASFAINYSEPWLYPLLVFCGGVVTIIEGYGHKWLQQKQARPVPIVAQCSATRQETVNNNLQQVEPQQESIPSEILNLPGWIFFGFWLFLLVLSIITRNFKNVAPLSINIFSTLYFVGSIIFGGGPVVIPLLQTYVVNDNNWMSNREFLLGLAMINSMPGPNFNLGAYCGALALRGTASLMWIGGLLGWIAIFSPGLLLMTALIPFWKKYRELAFFQMFFVGVNSAAVGLVIASVYLLSLKAIVPPGGDLGQVTSLTSSPLYTSVSAISYAMAGFTPSPAPLAILFGGLVGVCEWASSFFNKMTKRILTEAEKQISQQFALLQQNDFVAVGSNATAGHVLMNMLQSNPNPAPNSTTLEELLDANGTTKVQEEYMQKYREKLEKAAKSKGFKGVDDMLKTQKELEQEAQKKLNLDAEANVKENMDKSNVSAKDHSSKDSQRQVKASNLPGSVKTLNEILKLELIENETPENIGKIWNLYHSTRNCLSACLDTTFYDRLFAQSKQVPMFVLPLPRQDGYEIFLLQFQGHQIYFTQLLEYQTNKENARPAFCVSFYNDLAKSKGIVLMQGELSDPKGPLKVEDAQNLVYQLQIFYVTGNETQRGLVEKFWKNPAAFNYEELIRAIEQLA